MRNVSGYVSGGTGLGAARRRSVEGTRHLSLVCLAFWLLLAGSPRPLHAQQQHGPFGRYGLEHGLSHPSVLSIWQDDSGFMWFGTEDGLNRFDGHNFLTYRHQPGDSTSLSESWVNTIAGDGRGGLWIGTRRSGFNRFDLETRKATRYRIPPLGTAKPDATEDVTSILVDGHVLWIGVNGGGVNRLDLETGAYTQIDSRIERFADFRKDDIWCLYQDRQGYIWAGRYAYGLTRIDPATLTFTHYNYRAGDPTAIGGDRIRDIVEDHTGAIWVATSGGGLNRLDPRTGKFKRFRPVPGDPRSLSHDVVWSVFEDSHGNVWAGTWGGGLNRFDRATETFTRFQHDPGDPNSLPGNVVNTIYEDRSGLLWFGTDSGVATYNPASEYITHFGHVPSDPGTLGHNDVLAVVEREAVPNTFWVGTSKGGLNLLDRASGRVSRVQAGELGRVVVWSVAEDAGGTVWVGSPGHGVFAYTPHTGAVTRYHHREGDPRSLSSDLVRVMMVDRRGTVWVGTDGFGLNRLDPASGVVTRYQYDPNGSNGLGGRVVAALAEDEHGLIWVGTEKGVSHLDPATGRFTVFRYDEDDPTSLSHNHVYGLHVAGDGAVWVATYGGLNRFDDRTGRFTRYTVREGLAADVLYGIVGGEEGVVWLTTSRGLSKLDPRTGAIINYTGADGLPNVRFNLGAITLSRAGEIFLGGPNGLDVFHPGALQHKKYEPPLAITALKKFGEVAAMDLRDGYPVRLSHEDTYFSLDFALLDYTNPDAHTFRYRLEGFDADWQTVNGPIGSAHYRNDGRFGAFSFVVQGIDGKGRTSERRLAIVIVPPWWLSRWFRALCLVGALLLSGTALTYGYRRRQQELIEKRRMLSQGREQERHFLARELHDVPLQNLYSVRHRLEVIAREIPLNGQAGDLEAARSLLEETAEDLRRICGELRPPSLGPFGLSKAIRSHLRGFEEAHPEVLVEFDLMPDGQMLPEPMRLALFRIYQGALGNVARHAGANRVWVRFWLTDQEAVLEVEDDGRGFVVPRNWLEMARQQHYGLLGIAEWAESIGGVLAVRSAPGEGALVQVRVPVAGERRFFLPLSVERLGALLKHP